MDDLPPHSQFSIPNLLLEAVQLAPVKLPKKTFLGRKIPCTYHGVKNERSSLSFANPFNPTKF